MSSPPAASRSLPAPPFGKERYHRLRAALDLRPALLPTLAIIGLDLGLGAAAVALLRAGGLGPYLLSQCLLAVVFFNSFSILHECGHGNLSRSGVVNALVGHWASTFCFIPFFPWRYIHEKHHLWAGNLDRDPVLRSLRQFRDRGVPRVVQLAWWSWIPVAAFLQHFVYLTYPAVAWRAGEMDRGRLVRTALSIAWLPLSYAGLAVLLGGLGVRPADLLLGYVLFLAAEELVNLPHHVDMPTFPGRLPLWDQHRTTRSCYYPPGLSELAVLNFNFHIEHHLFPSLPWHRLRRARLLVKEALGSEYTECVGVSWNLRNRARDLETIVSRYRAPGARAA